MEPVAALIAQPVLRDWRRKVATTIVVLTLGTLLIAGEAVCRSLRLCASISGDCRTSAAGAADWSVALHQGEQTGLIAVYAIGPTTRVSSVYSMKLW